jgi:hypothetical protein
LAHRSVKEEVRKRFGWKPGAIEFLKDGRDMDGVCSVTVGFEKTVLLVFANGMLVGVPPKKEHPDR